jgi:HlyD family secretion protein
MKGRKKVLLPLAVILIIAVAAYTYHRSRANNKGNVIQVSGNIEVTDVEMSFKIPGWVKSRLVSEGETVKKGQNVAILDDSELQQEALLREAEVTTSKAALAELEAGSRPEEIARAEAAAESARAEEALRKTEFDRLKELYENSAASKQEYDKAKAAYEVAKGILNQANESLSLAKEGPRKETLEVARAKLKQAEQAHALAKTRLSFSILASPISGVVLLQNIESGEYVSPGTPIVTIGNLDNVWLRAYIEETDLGRIKVGQRVTVRTDTYPDKKYEGKITFISPEAEFTPKNVQTKKLRVSLVYRIKVAIPNPDIELKPGMPVDAEIYTEEPQAR